MKHLEDQDLLLLAHRSLGFVQSLSAHRHLARCESCRSRYAQFGALSRKVASLVRPGLPTWKPLGMALRTKVLISVFLGCVGLFGVEMAVLPRTPAPVHIPIQQIASPNWPSCPEGKPAPKKGPATAATLQINPNAKEPTRRKR
ncbi:MAG TPA: hypothetical protein VHE55_02580 [Fimbriimonadaceae bacterium]|nr:hypothetical protein [Fimbriimonadaceae bacterium]